MVLVERHDGVVVDVIQEQVSGLMAPPDRSNLNPVVFKMFLGVAQVLGGGLGERHGEWKVQGSLSVRI